MESFSLRQDTKRSYFEYCLSGLQSIKGYKKSSWNGQGLTREDDPADDIFMINQAIKVFKKSRKEEVEFQGGVKRKVRTPLKLQPGILVLHGWRYPRVNHIGIGPGLRIKEKISFFAPVKYVWGNVNKKSDGWSITIQTEVSF